MPGAMKAECFSAEIKDGIQDSLKKIFSAASGGHLTH
jgi:hypothetical protein